jgi:hypothetical protein
MFNPKTPTTPTDLELAIARLHALMLAEDPTTDNYSKLSDNLIKLYKLREHDTVKRWRPSPDVVLTATVNIVGILMVIRHEDVNVITTKAMGMIRKPG